MSSVCFHGADTEVKARGNSPGRLTMPEQLKYLEFTVTETVQFGWTTFAAVKLLANKPAAHWIT
jgi:hypothetical protein